MYVHSCGIVCTQIQNLSKHGNTWSINTYIDIPYVDLSAISTLQHPLKRLYSSLLSYTNTFTQTSTHLTYYRGHWCNGSTANIADPTGSGRFRLPVTVLRGWKARAVNSALFSLLVVWSVVAPNPASVQPSHRAFSLGNSGEETDGRLALVWCCDQSRPRGGPGGGVRDGPHDLIQYVWLDSGLRESERDLHNRERFWEITFWT